MAKIRPRPPKMPRRPKLAFFFGAGSEVAYGLPSGGRFALEVLKGSKRQVQAFKDYRDYIDVNCSASYREWLPDQFKMKQVLSLTGTDQSRVFEDSLATGYKRIIERLDNFDAAAIAFLSAIGWTEKKIASTFATLSGGKRFGENVYSYVKIKRSVSDEPALLFASKYFSAMIDLSRDGPISESMALLTHDTNQLYLGAHGQGTMLSMSDNPLVDAPEDNPAFQELGSMFEMHSLDAGASAFKAVMAHRDESAITELNVFPLIATMVLESAVEQFLDYRSIVDELTPSLFRPKEQWGKFTKIFTFLMGAREYMLPKQESGLKKTQGYYHDLVKALDLIDIVSVGTSNYTSICTQALAERWGGKVVHLNGSLAEFLDPYKGEIVSQESQANIARFLVPFLFTQSGIKPLTSVEVSRRFVNYYDEIVESDAAIVIGFGFNNDDGHINSLFRQAIDRHNLPLIVLSHSPSGRVDADSGALMAKALRVAPSSDLTVLAVNNARQIDGRPWLDAVIDTLKR
jgi:hypothetical protein